MENNRYHHPRLGPVVFLQSERHKRYIFKVINGQLTAIIPAGGWEETARELIENNLGRLEKLLSKSPPGTIRDQSTDLWTATFRMQIRLSDNIRNRVIFHNGQLTLFFPSRTDFKDESIQRKIDQVLRNVCRQEAKRVLPGQVEELARQHGFRYGNVRITQSRTRWGSCNQKGNICLSLHLMRLPWQLIHYVILHELCHTIEMNHGKKFWDLLDRVTQHRALALRQELRQHSISA